METSRLDKWLVENHHFESREKAKQAIESGVIKINDEQITKSSAEVTEGDVVTVAYNPLKYVSRGGYKLEKAIREFQIDFYDKTVLDIGASTGGFTDCALQQGAKKVFAVDVGSDQLHESLRRNQKVISLEKTDIRTLTPQQTEGIVDIVIADLSFISLKKIFSSVRRFLNKEGAFLALVKPQFEIGQRKKFKKGIIRDELLREKILQEVLTEAANEGFVKSRITTTDITNDKKNMEYLILFKMNVSE